MVHRKKLIPDLNICESRGCFTPTKLFVWIRLEGKKKKRQF